MKEALKLALEALEWFTTAEQGNEPPINKAITAIKEALAQPEQEQEPVAVARVDDLERGGRVRALAMGLSLDAPIYTTPPKRPWVGLTDEQIWKFWSSRPEVPEGEDDSMEAEFVAAVRRVLAAHGIGAKLKEKNT
jgi:hypothetical protein